MLIKKYFLIFYRTNCLISVDYKIKIYFFIKILNFNINALKKFYFVTIFYLEDKTKKIALPNLTEDGLDIRALQKQYIA